MEESVSFEPDGVRECRRGFGPALSLCSWLDSSFQLVGETDRDVQPHTVPVRVVRRCPHQPDIKAGGLPLPSSSPGKLRGTFVTLEDGEGCRCDRVCHEGCTHLRINMWCSPYSFVRMSIVVPSALAMRAMAETDPDLSPRSISER